MQTSISFLSSAYSFEKTIALINASKADFIHVDVMDGLFVPNVTNFTKEKLELLRKSPKPKEVHLMTLHLKKYIDIFSLLNPEIMIYEFESTTNHQKVINAIKEKGIKVGIAISPLTDIQALTPYLKKIDLVLVMGVIPGAGGQEFLEETVERVNMLYTLRKEKNLEFFISVDGGIKDTTIQLIKKQLDRVVTGSYVCKSIDFNKQIEKLVL